MITYQSSMPEIQIKYKKGDFKRVKIQGSKDAFEIGKQLFNNDTIEVLEEFLILYLNRGNKSIAWFRVSQGGMTGTVVDVRIIMKTALDVGAIGMILYHNHPSGNKDPSSADETLTQKIKGACAFFDITLIDHIIVSGETDNGTGEIYDYFSMADNGLI